MNAESEMADTGFTSVSLPVELVAQIDALLQRDRRFRSRPDFIRFATITALERAEA